MTNSEDSSKKTLRRLSRVATAIGFLLAAWGLYVLITTNLSLPDGQVMIANPQLVIGMLLVVQNGYVELKLDGGDADVA